MSRGKGERVGGGVVYFVIDKFDILWVLRVVIFSVIFGIGFVFVERFEFIIFEYFVKVYGVV